MTEHRFELVTVRHPDGGRVTGLFAECSCGWRHGAPARDADHARDLWEHHGDPGKARARGRLRYAITEGWKIGLLAIALVACSSGPRVYAGTVVDKDHDPAYTAFIPITTCTGGYGSTPRTCTTTQVPIFHPEGWAVQVESCDTPHDTEACPRTWWDVDPDTYAGLELGAWFDSGKEPDA